MNDKLLATFYCVLSVDLKTNLYCPKIIIPQFNLQLIRYCLLLVLYILIIMLLIDM